MPTAVAPSIESQVIAWNERRDISARSVLVTILGDTVAPLGGSIWLADLITLAEAFGFSDRLVRTSMFRLVAEGWVMNERVGRRSRYSLTEFGLAEIADAASRIYRRSAQPWDGQWTLAFLASAPDEDLERHLRWRGFVRIAGDVLAMPNADAESARQLFERLGLDPQPMVAVAEFDSSGPVTDARTFRAASGLARAEATYRDFVDRYEWTTSLTADDLDPRDAFLLRTMIVHDLRRARLSDPELPADLLPVNWIGNQSMALAGSAYRVVDDASWCWAESVTGLIADRSDPQLARRFVDPPPTTKPTEDTV